MLTNARSEATATLVVALLVSLAGCGRQGAAVPKPAPAKTDIALAVPNQHQQKAVPPPAHDLPPPVLSLKAPAEPSPIAQGKDLREQSPELLRAMADAFVAENSFEKAVQYQYWFVQKTDEGRYDLARCESIAGRIDAGFYWLQEAARLEGVNANSATEDPHLFNLRHDSRWEQFAPFLKQCETYWREKRPKQTLVIVPKGHDGRVHLKWVAWMHHMGAGPADIQSRFQRLADRHNVGFICVSGPLPAGKTKFSWTENAAEDFERVRAALDEAEAKLKGRPERVVILGLGQGATAGIEIAVRHPETFAGAICISAAVRPLHLDEVRSKNGLPHQGYVIVSGDREVYFNILTSNRIADWLKSNKANVLKPSYPDHSTRSFPSDFDEQFPEWLEFVLKAHPIQDGR